MSEGITDVLRESTVKVQLSIPVITEKDGKELVVDSLTLGRIKLKDLKDMPSSIFTGGETDLKSIISLIAASAKLPIEIIEEIDMTDIGKITEAIDPFLPRFPQTGTN